MSEKDERCVMAFGVLVLLTLVIVLAMWQGIKIGQALERAQEQTRQRELEKKR